MLGKAVGKAGVSQVLIVKTVFVMVICIISGFFLVISSLVNWGKSYFEFLFWIGIFVVAFAPIQFFRLKMEESSVGKYIFYENGFEDVLKKRKIFFEDVKNYFYLNLENASDNVEFIVIEVENKENLTNNAKEKAELNKNKKRNLEKIVIDLKLNRMASKLFVKNYIEFILKNELDEKNKNVQNNDNFEFKFGIIEEKNSMKDKIFSLNMDKNLEKVKIYEYIFLNKNGIRVENQEGKILEKYFWNETGNVKFVENENYKFKKKNLGTANSKSKNFVDKKLENKNLRNKSLKILDKDGKVIFSSDMMSLEKPELFVKLLEKYAEVN